MPQLRRRTPPADNKSSSQPSIQENPRESTEKNGQLMSLICSKIRYLSQLMTVPSSLHECMMEQQWQQKINDRFLKYPHIPGAKLFNKLSSECWNQVFLQKEENEAYFRDAEMHGEYIEDEIRKTSRQIKEIEEKTGINYSI